MLVNRGRIWGILATDSSWIASSKTVEILPVDSHVSVVKSSQIWQIWMINWIVNIEIARKPLNLSEHSRIMASIIIRNHKVVITTLTYTVTLLFICETHRIVKYENSVACGSEIEQNDNGGRRANAKTRKIGSITNEKILLQLINKEDDR